MGWVAASLAGNSRGCSDLRSSGSLGPSCLPAWDAGVSCLLGVPWTCLGGIGAPHIHPGSLPPAPVGVSGNFVAVGSAFTQLCREDAVLPREVCSSCVGLSGGHQSRFLPKESRAKSSHFFKRLPSKWWLLLT